MRTKERSNRPQGGFTLLELMISMIILIVLMASVFPLMMGGQRSFQGQQANADAMANARFAMDRLSELVRNAGYNPQGANFQAVTLGTGGTSITIRSDLNGDGNITGTLGNGSLVTQPEALTISLNGSDVVMTDLNQNPPLATPIAQDVQALSFAQPSPREITVTVTVPIGAAARTPGVRSVTLTQNVFLRNIH